MVDMQELQRKFEIASGVYSERWYIGDSTGQIYDADGLIRVHRRDADSNIIEEKSVRAPTEGAVPTDDWGQPVRVGYDEEKRLAIKKIDFSATLSQGKNPITLNPGDSNNATGGSTSSYSIEQFKTVPTYPASLYLAILPYRFVLAGQVIAGGGQQINCTSNLPASGNHRIVGTFLKQDGTVEAIYSTAKSELDPLDDSDLQEIINNATPGSIPGESYKLYNGQTTITKNDYFRNLRPIFHPDPRDIFTLRSATALTINSGTITATQTYHTVTSESGTSDNLDTITAALTRQFLLIQAASGHTITVKHGTGNIQNNDAVDVVLSSGETLMLFYDGTNWRDLDTGSSTSESNSEAIIKAPDAVDRNRITPSVATAQGLAIQAHPSQSADLLAVHASNGTSYYFQVLSNGNVQVYTNLDILGHLDISTGLRLNFLTLSSQGSNNDVNITPHGTGQTVVKNLNVNAGTGDEGETLLRDSENGDFAAYPMPRDHSNLIIDGAFDFWDEQTSLTPSDGSSEYASTMHSVSRNDNGGDGSGLIADQQSFTLGQTDVPGEPIHYFRMQDRITGSPSGNEMWAYDYRFEGVQTAAGQNLTVSFWAYSTVAGTFGVGIWQNFGTGGSPSSNVWMTGQEFALSATTWTYVTLTFAVPSVSGKTLGTAGNDYTLLRIFKQAGSTRSTNSNLPSASYDVSGDFYLANMKAQIGSIATQFYRENLALTRHLINRYFYQIPTTGNTSRPFGLLFMSSTTVAIGVLHFPQMRAAPTLSTTGTFLVIYAGGSSSGISSIVGDLTGLNTIRIVITMSSAVLTAGQSGYWRANASSTATLVLDARL